MGEGSTTASRDALAKTLAAARLGGPPTKTLQEAEAPRSVAEAYAVQDLVHRELAGFGALSGHKIGCTTPVMQAYLGIDHPCAGEVFAGTVFRDHADLPLARFHRIGVECEIAVRLGSDIADIGRPHDRDTVRDHVAAVMAGIELVDDRYADFPSMPPTALIADDFFNAGVVLGQEITDWQAMDLSGLEGGMLVDGEPVGRGVGADILGHPLEALAWLANHRLAIGRPLAAGTFVMLGSLVKTVHFDRPAKVRIEIEQLGGASVRFT